MEWSGIYGAYGSILGSMAQSPIKLRARPESFPLDGSGHRFVVPKDLGVQGGEHTAWQGVALVVGAFERQLLPKQSMAKFLRHIGGR